MVLVVLAFGGLLRVVLVWFDWCLILLYGLVAFGVCGFDAGCGVVVL